MGKIRNFSFNKINKHKIFKSQSYSPSPGSMPDETYFLILKKNR